MSGKGSAEVKSSRKAPVTPVVAAGNEKNKKVAATARMVTVRGTTTTSSSKEKEKDRQRREETKQLRSRAAQPKDAKAATELKRAEDMKRPRESSGAEEAAAKAATELKRAKRAA